MLYGCGDDYALLDSGLGEKLEAFGPVVLRRPCAQALWRRQLSEDAWTNAHGSFTREGELRWSSQKKLPEHWEISTVSFRFKILLTDFGHLGIFPEQRPFWSWISGAIGAAKKMAPSAPVRLLNLFAYSGGVTLAGARAGAEVCHVDASKGMVAWARENAALNKLEGAPIRWIVDDATKFLKREVRRQTRYDAIVLDPPSFGRGANGEIFKIERDLLPLLDLCRDLLSPRPLFFLLSCHTPGLTPITMGHLIKETMGGLSGAIDCGEMTLTGAEGIRPLPSGSYARWYDGR